MRGLLFEKQAELAFRPCGGCLAVGPRSRLLPDDRSGEGAEMDTFLWFASRS
eukprot:COSAG05_NODE_3230_length_2221_cov_2428.137931_3_plen_52_part_00